MSRRSLLLTVLGASAAGVLGLLVWENHSEAKRTEALVGQTRDRAAWLERERRSVETRLREVDAATLRGSAAITRVEKPATGPGERDPARIAQPAPAKRRTLNILETIRNEPDAEVLYLADSRSRLAAKYGPLMRRLGLGPEQERKFQDIVIRQQEQRMDLSDAARNGSPAGPVAKLQAAASAEYEAAQRALLGEDGYEQLRDYERTSYLRIAVSAIAGMAVVEKSPFTAQQTEELVAALARASSSYQRGRGWHSADVDWERAENEARRILSPTQFEIFTTMDPGPTTPGLLQTRLYARVMAAEIEAQKKAQTQKQPGS